MEVQYFDSPVPHIIIDNWFTEDHLENIWKEVEMVTEAGVLVLPDQTGSALDSTGKVTKRNHGVFLDTLYGQAITSSYIFNHFRETWAQQHPREAIAQSHWMFEYIKKFNLFSSLLSYYEDGDSYLPHCDESLLTICIHLFKEPRKFQGGELCIGDKVIPLVNNRFIMFPSIVTHSVKPVEFLEPDQKMSGNGRYTITYFLDYDYSKVKR